MKSEILKGKEFLDTNGVIGLTTPNYKDLTTEEMRDVKGEGGEQGSVSWCSDFVRTWGEIGNETGRSFEGYKRHYCPLEDRIYHKLASLGLGG